MPGSPGADGMIYALADLELDLDRVELRHLGAVVAVEPQVFALLVLLVENHDRMVSRDEIVERVWDGRIVSETAISSRVKAARRAVGDDGSAQRIIKTIHGRGFRCVADVRIVADAAAAATVGDPNRSAQAVEGPRLSSMPSLAVLPFRQIDAGGRYGLLAEAVPHEIISALARLRWLRVIARGSSFRFREEHPDVRVVGLALGVRYCLTGFIEADDTSLALSVELADTSDGSIVWSETFKAPVSAVHDIRSEITSRIVAALETHVPSNEARSASQSPPESLDAWATYHLGLQRMFRFSSADNAAAAGYFEEAIRLDPGLARAHAGLSFTRFQNAYLSFDPDRERNVRDARASAERGVSLDPLDPFANFTLGRSYWLEGDLEASLGWLDRAKSLSPSYAQGVYARAWADTLLGNAEAGRQNVDAAISLSPIDPFLFAMKGTRALSYIVEGRIAEAAFWIDEAARTPGANAVVTLVAAVTHSMNGNQPAAAEWIKRARLRNPNLTTAGFFRAIPFADSALRTRVSVALSRHGID